MPGREAGAARRTRFPRRLSDALQEEGVDAGLVAGVRDLEARVEILETANDAQQATVRRLSDLDQLRADYVAGITHDLRTPLTGLVGFLGTLRQLGESAEPVQRAEYLDIMERQATRLVNMVEDLLLAARIDGARVEPGDRNPVDLADLVEEALETYEPERRMRVKVMRPLEAVRCLGDRSQLVRVVRNLLDNALRYSPAATPVDVVVEARGREVVLGVRDQGRGIDDRDRDLVFDRFGRGREGERAGSTGLGLYISRSIARGHGGDIVFESEPGDGTTFWLSLPAERAVTER